MRFLITLALIATCFLSQAQNREYPNAISAKLNFIDYGLFYNQELHLSQGFEVGYFRNVHKYVNIGIPVKVGVSKLPTTFEKNMVTFSGDLVAQICNTGTSSKLMPYLFFGGGIASDDLAGTYVQAPVGAGVQFKLGKYASLALQGEFRKAFSDNRDNFQASAGFFYLLHAPDPSKLDADGDGTPDAIDKCPGIAGPATALGCPDADKDGVADNEDLCPEDPGPLETNGCPDADSDGYPDSMDKCPDVPGTLEGCPDADKDGFADYEDECPTVAGRWKGCPDTDLDGIPDKDDKCPTVAGSEANMGCPEKMMTDSDNDGIMDDKDECPNTPGTVNGCPDADEDGIADKDDNCPTEKGSIANGGCPAADEIDSDKDGFPDITDACPNQAGPVKGCPDADNDGVADKDDMCPNEPGTVNGCPDSDRDGIADKDDPCPNKPGTFGGCPDSDTDGIPDNKDNCPNEAGPSSNNGCPVAEIPRDTDGDGIIDAEDKCPNTPGPASNFGCPEIKKETKERLAFAMQAVQFETGKATLKGSSFSILDEIVEIMRQYPDYKLSISGHTDDIGDEDTNLRLSTERAKTCYDYLIFRGISAQRLRFAGFGEARPLADNDSASGREVNRRVEFELTLN